MRRFIFIGLLIVVLVFPLDYALSNDNEIIDYSLFDIEKSERPKETRYKEKSEDNAEERYPAAMPGTAGQAV